MACDDPKRGSGPTSLITKKSSMPADDRGLGAAIEPAPDTATNTDKNPNISISGRRALQKVGVGDYFNDVCAAESESEGEPQLQIPQPLLQRKRRRGSGDGSTQQASRRQRRSSPPNSIESCGATCQTTSTCPCCSASKQIISSLLWLVRNGGQLTDTGAACESCGSSVSFQATCPSPREQRNPRQAKAIPSKPPPKKRNNKANNIPKKQSTRASPKAGNRRRCPDSTTSYQEDIQSQPQQPKISASGRLLRGARMPARYCHEKAVTM